MTFKHQSDLLASGRRKQGLTQKFLSEKLKLSSPQCISNIERGVAPIPSKHVRKLSKLLDVPPADFFEAYVKDERARWKKNGL